MRKRISPAIVCFAAIGIAVSIAGYSFTSSKIDEANALRLTRFAEKTTEAVRQQVSSSTNVLLAIQGLYVASRSVKREDFRNFVRTMVNRDGIQALEWIPRVSASSRADFESLARRDGLEGFQFTERHAQGSMARAGARAEYFPVYFVEPLARNRAALGFDLGSNSTRLAALNQARDSGRMIATERITLVQETGTQFGFLVFAPIYRPGTENTTVAERRKNLMGFGLGVFRVGDMVAKAVGAVHAGGRIVAVRIDDDQAPKDKRLLYRTDGIGENDRSGWTMEPVVRTFDVGGRQWSITVSPMAGGALSETSLISWFVLVAGFVITGLAVFSITTLEGRRHYAEGLADDRMKQLKFSNDLLKIQAEELSRSNAELERFAFVAAHDLQEPLRKVQAFGDRLSLKYADSLPEDGQKNIERMRGAAGRMQMLIEDLMNYSRVGTQGGSFVSVDMNEVAEGVVSDLGEMISEAGAIIEVGDLPTIDADPVQMRQLLQNLIGNGLKFGREDVQPVVSIAAGSPVRSGSDRTDGTPGFEQCEIVVKDNGIGFDSQHSESIFEVFKRLHRQSDYAGSGIGLSICRRIVERHGGQISATGVPGEGAEFRVVLPIRQAKQEVAYEAA